MKIGFDSRPAKWYRGTGIGNYTYQLANWFRQDTENDYHMFVPEGWEFDINFNDNFTFEKIKGSDNDNFWEQIKIPNIIDDRKLSIYHVPQNGAGLPIEKKCPTVITLHDVIPYRMPQTCSDRLIKIFNEELPKIVDSCDGIITVSEFSKRDIARSLEVPLEKIYVTHLAAEDIYKPRSKSKSRSYIKRVYGIDDEFILYIGGFSPRKNIIGLMEAFSRLIQNYNSNVKLVIAGTRGISYERYKQRSIDLKIQEKVIFPGFIPMEDMPYLYSGAKFLVYPSFYEGFGLPPVEAMACGTPVITSNLTSIPEIVDGAALLVDPYDVDELSSAMKNVLSSRELRKTLIDEGFRRTSALSWQKTASLTLDVYKKISSLSSHDEFIPKQLRIEDLNIKSNDKKTDTY